jgi:pimeloyl-ACP methyl ester carboxylesterase
MGGIPIMTLSRRHLLQATMGSLLASRLASAARAQGPAGVAAGETRVPVVFAHGHGDHAALWITTLWRLESNGFPRDRLLAFNFTDPLARNDDAEPQAGRSSTADQLRELAAAVDTMRQRTGSPRVALVANSRGGYAVRNYIRNGGAEHVSHAVLCGVPNRGVFDWEFNPGNEFNGRAPFLQRLNAGETDVVPGVAFLTLRSDGNDKYAQPDGRFVGKPGTPTGITADGPSLRGATNLVLGQLDHREVGFHPRAFREIYKFIAGSEPERLGIVAEPRVTLNGLVTGFPAGVPTNRPLGGAAVELYRVSPETGERLGAPVHRRVTEPDGVWGPATVEPTWYLEFVVEAAAHPTTHIYRSPFPRSSGVMHLRPGRPVGDKDAGAGAVVLMSRPRGYFGIPRDVVLLDGKEPKDVTAGVPTDSVATLRLSAGEAQRPIVALFNEERIVARGWPVAENRIAIAEFTY